MIVFAYSYNNLWITPLQTCTFVFSRIRPISDNGSQQGREDAASPIEERDQKTRREELYGPSSDV